MHKKLRSIFLALPFLLSCHLYGQTSSSGKGGAPQGISPSTIVRPPLGTPPDKLGPKPPDKDHGASGPVYQMAPQFSYRPIFMQPGILSLRGGGFVGVDHLYNVSGTIPVVVEMVKSDALIIGVTKESIQMMIEKNFEKEGISTLVKPSEGPPLPFFQMLIMVIQSDEAISAFCGGRLFEKVELERVALPAGVYFQAITWEYQNLISAAKEDIDKQINDAVSDIVQQFLSRYKYYKNITVQ